MRREVEMLQKTWEMLDDLHRRGIHRNSSPEKTISEIRRTRDERRFLAAVVAFWSARLPVVMVYLCAGGSVSPAHGFAVTRWVWPDPTKRLVEDLTLAEHLDEYLEVGSFDFLERTG